MVHPSTVVYLDLIFDFVCGVMVGMPHSMRGAYLSLQMQIMIVNSYPTLNNIIL